MSSIPAPIRPLEFSLAQSFWTASAPILVLDASATFVLLTIPAAFLTGAGSSCNRWSYILDQVQACYEGQGVLLGDLGLALSDRDPVKPGTVRFVPSGT